MKNSCYGYRDPDWTPMGIGGSTWTPISYKALKVILIEAKTVCNLTFVCSQGDSFLMETFLFYLEEELLFYVKNALIKGKLM